ncbi:MAG: cation ABC transporter substrate-binding protein [Desulfobacterales bacterium]|nr:MAG: cation ABC transporter substrate-binding protein [Desulfobacterales bacterium]
MAVFFLAAVLAAGNALAAGPPKVFVSILPQKYFVEQIAGEKVSVEVMVQPGASPATYEPKPSQMRKLAGAAAYFSIGVPFENAWLERITRMNPDMILVRTDEGIEKMAMGTHRCHGHNDGHDHGRAHGHKGLDPHIWLAAELVKAQVGTIRKTLIRLFPAHQAAFQANGDAFMGKIDQVDAAIKDLLRDRAGMKFMVFHPSWGYFARAYGLEQLPIEVEGKDPKPARLKELIRLARSEKIRIIFAQPQFSTKSAELLAQAIDGKVLLIDPLAEDWLSNMRDAARKFQEIIHR